MSLKHEPASELLQLNQGKVSEASFAIESTNNIFLEIAPRLVPFFSSLLLSSLELSDTQVYEP